MYNHAENVVFIVENLSNALILNGKVLILRSYRCDFYRMNTIHVQMKPLIEILDREGCSLVIRSQGKEQC